MPDLLSEEWFEALAEVIQSLPASTDSDEPPAGDGLALGQIVTGIPDGAGAADVHAGEVRFTIVLRQNGTGSLVRDSTEPAKVVLVEDWATAEAIASGGSSVPDLLTAGRIKVRGDSRALVSAGDLLARVAPLIAAALGSRKGS